ncbi:ABC transporter substrate-binding protein [Sphingomonas sp. HF-S4]|uniref:ABC transporter substrate-binding protein n=1 Tax=Sphingomonas agrestis TaxID=3080540 RepID=A0ABU3Y806_9SPHN|nr:ABC transporter substrate-binding protein [Sphingomonas sp. HF-S4]MDV3457543.1 ABC transporter substrate-binding protein [Sphingomonas sp. HF-S4]
MLRISLPLLLGLALATGGCGSGGQRKDNTPVVVSAVGGEAKPADPSTAPLGAGERVLMGATAQGLVRFDAAGQIEPALAERWIVIDDGRSYIFRLREAYWPDGEPVSAAQVVRVLRRAAAPGSRNALAPFLAVIDEIVEMTPTVIEVRLKRPRPDLLKLFAQPELAVFRTGSLDGSGPFLARPLARGVLLRPARDPARGSDPGEPEPEEMVQLLAERAAVAVARFKARKSDLVLGGSFVDWPLLAPAELAPANIRVEQPLGLFGLVVANREGFLADPANRGAIAMAIDRIALVQAVRPEWAPIETLLPGQLDSAMPPARPGWATLALDARRQSARERVQAWRRDHPEPLRLRIALPAGPGATLVWGHLAEAMLRIGAAPERVGPDDPAELRLIDAIAPYDSGRWFVQTACVVCSDDAKALVLAGREAVDLPSRAQRIAEADAVLTADAAYIPLAQPLRWSLVALRLGAWQGNARGWHPLNHLRDAKE